MKLLIIYLIVINIYGICIMYADKHKSQKGKWRIPEARLFGVAVILGSPGILAGMYMFRHKTKHAKFVFGIPVILMIQIYIFYKFRYIFR